MARTELKDALVGGLMLVTLIVVVVLWAVSITKAPAEMLPSAQQAIEGR